MDGIESAMARGDWEAAVHACQAALQVSPTSARLYGYLGMCHFRRAEFALAVPAFERATTLDPQFVDAGIRLAQCYDRLGRYEEAYAAAKQWRPLRPSDVTLNAILTALADRVTEGRIEGWERSRGGGREVRLASEDR